MSSVPHMPHSSCDAPVPAAAACSRYHPAQMEGRLLGRDVLTDWTDRRLLDSPRPAHPEWRDSGALFTPGPDTASEGGERREHQTHAPSMYHHMMDYIDSVFEDALGQRVERDGPVAPGASTSTARGGPILLNRAQPVHYFMEQANRDYLKANEEKLSKSCEVSGWFEHLFNLLLSMYSFSISRHLHFLPLCLFV